MRRTPGVGLSESALPACVANRSDWDPSRKSLGTEVPAELSRWAHTHTHRPYLILHLGSGEWSRFPTLERLHGTLARPSLQGVQGYRKRRRPAAAVRRSAELPRSYARSPLSSLFCLRQADPEPHLHTARHWLAGQGGADTPPTS